MDLVLQEKVPVVNFKSSYAPTVFLPVIHS